MARVRTLDNRVVVAAPAARVWACAVTPAGINHEMRPWLTMTMPRGARDLTVDTLPVGRPIGRAWLRLLGVVPFDYDRLVVVEVEPGRRFLERSTMLSMRRWEHERTLTDVAGGTEVHDRVSFEPRFLLRPAAPVLVRVVDAFFRHRHRRLWHFLSDVESGRGPGSIPTSSQPRSPDRSGASPRGASARGQSSP